MAALAGRWFNAEPKLIFELQHDDPVVHGTFRDAKGVFTCELKGVLAGNHMSLSFETTWNWLNVHDIGAAALELSADGATLSGPVLMSGKSGRWTLTRTEQPLPPPAPSPPEPTPAPWPGQHLFIPSHGGGGGGGGGEPAWPYPMRIHKEVWDAQADPALLQRLRKRADGEPELKALLQKRNML